MIGTLPFSQKNKCAHLMSEAKTVLYLCLNGWVELFSGVLNVIVQYVV